MMLPPMMLDVSVGANDVGFDVESPPPGAEGLPCAVPVAPVAPGPLCDPNALCDDPNELCDDPNELCDDPNEL